MRETILSADGAITISPRLAALAAGISQGNAKRIAKEIAAGQRLTWRGASVKVRTFTGGRRSCHRFVVATLAG